MARKIPLHDYGSLRVRPPLVASGQRIGVMGGTFNPPHDGHRIIAETAIKRLGLDQLWWVATPGNPLKGHDDLSPLAERLADMRDIAHGPRMKLTGFERELGTPYTAATLAFLKRRYRGVQFVWVMGADNLATFDRWQHWRTIAATMPIAIIDRPGWRLKALAGAAAGALASRRIPEGEAAGLWRRGLPAWVFLTSRLSPLSSTSLRGDTSARRVARATAL
ncbi:MAG: nicotinate-nucleotide adenylyltransferase [Hyphomicrobium sp.]